MQYLNTIYLYIYTSTVCISQLAVEYVLGIKTDFITEHKCKESEGTKTWSKKMTSANIIHIY